jgi:hypothetical protein
LPPKCPTYLSRGGEFDEERLEGFCQVLEEALASATKDLDRLILARELMHRVTRESPLQSMGYRVASAGSSRRHLGR